MKRSVKLRCASRPQILRGYAMLLMSWALGAMGGAVLRETEHSASALVIECDKTGLNHELESFRRISGDGDEMSESTWWLPDAVLYTEDPSLGLNSNDPNIEEVFVQLESGER